MNNYRLLGRSSKVQQGVLVIEGIFFPLQGLVDKSRGKKDE